MRENCFENELNRFEVRKVGVNNNSVEQADDDNSNSVEQVDIKGGSNMTGTNCDLFTHKSSRSYLNHLVIIIVWNKWI